MCITCFARTIATMARHVKHLEEFSASQDEKAKEQVEAAIAEQKAELVRTNERLYSRHSR